MPYLSVGDMAQTYQLRRHSAGMKEQLGTLSHELATGTRKDLAGAVSGDFTALSGIERSLRTLSAFSLAASEAGQLMSAVQVSLEKIQAVTSDTGTYLISSMTNASPTTIDGSAREARQKFLTVVSTLNTQIGERYLFSGTTTDTRPMRPGADILSVLSIAVAAETTAGAVEVAIDGWFDSPPGGGGFLDTAYLGGSMPLAGFEIGPETIVDSPLTATDAGIRETLKSLAMLAVLADGILEGNVDERRKLASSAGLRVMSADAQLTAMRADVGLREGRIEETIAQNAAEVSALEIARSDMISADPYDTATALEAVQTQIETLYTLTARLSRLSLADYL